MSNRKFLNSSRKKALKTAALLGGVALVANELVKSGDSTNRSANLPAETPTPNYLKGEQGEPGPQGNRGVQGEQGIQGVQGIPGVPGLPGSNAPIYSGLLKDGAFLHGLTGWYNEGFEISAEKANGLPVAYGHKTGATRISLSHAEKVYINPHRLYKLAATVKGNVAAVNLMLLSHDLADEMIAKQNGSFVTFGGSVAATTNYTKVSTYVGGIGNLGSNFPEGVIYGAFFIFSEEDNKELFISNVELGRVGLWEPVPSNLPWLPAGQMVYDSVTGETGRFNGSTIIWITA